jgi:hypothetical protein
MLSDKIVPKFYLITILQAKTYQIIHSNKKSENNHHLCSCIPNILSNLCHVNYNILFEMTNQFDTNVLFLSFSFLSCVSFPTRELFHFSYVNKVNLTLERNFNMLFYV